MSLTEEQIRLIVKEELDALIRERRSDILVGNFFNEVIPAEDYAAWCRTTEALARLKDYGVTKTKLHYRIFCGIFKAGIHYRNIGHPKAKKPTYEWNIGAIKASKAGLD